MFLPDLLYRGILVFPAFRTFFQPHLQDLPRRLPHVGVGVGEGRNEGVSPLPVARLRKDHRRPDPHPPVLPGKGGPQRRGRHVPYLPERRHSTEPALLHPQSVDEGLDCRSAYRDKGGCRHVADVFVTITEGPDKGCDRGVSADGAEGFGRLPPDCLVGIDDKGGGEGGRGLGR